MHSYAGHPHKMIKSVFFFSLLFILHWTCGAQVIQEKPQEEVKIFNENELPTAPKKDTIPSLQRAFTFGVLHLARGKFPLFLEQSLGAHVGICVGAGLSYADYFRDRHRSIVLNSSSGKIKLGLHTEAMAKFYFAGIALEDYYTGLNFKFTQFNLTEFEVDQDNDITEQHFELILVGGIQFADTDNILVYDYYAGFGFSNILTVEEEIVNTTGTFAPIEITSYSGFRPVLRLGFKIGIKLK